MFLAEKIKSTDFPSDKQVVTTYGESVLVKGSNLSMLDCNHEEADTRLVFHAQHALQQGSIYCMVRTVYTDVVVILTGKFYQLQDLCPKANIWVAFGAVDIQSDSFRILERFTITLYQRTSPLESVNEVRREMFCQQNKTMETIPPTQAALLEHTKRAVYQAEVWSTCDLAQQELPTPEKWGWKMDSDSQCWTPLWTLLPVASNACGELVKCGCKTAAGCRGKCACKKALWTCTELCKCNCTRK